MSRPAQLPLDLLDEPPDLLLPLLLLAPSPPRTEVEPELEPSDGPSPDDDLPPEIVRPEV